MHPRLFPSMELFLLYVSLVVLLGNLMAESLQAQTIAPTQIPNPVIPIPNKPLEFPSPPPSPLPNQENPLRSKPSTSPSPQESPDAKLGTINVKRYEVVGSTIFSLQKLADVTKPFTGESVSFEQMLKAREAVEKLYAEKYLITTVFIPPGQSIQIDGGVVTIKVIERGLNAEQIKVTGTRLLDPNYVRSHIAIATSAPLNKEGLVQALRLLQLDPLIASVSAELSPGIKPGMELLEVKVKESPPFTSQINLDNNRSPSVGSLERQLQINQANLLGLGDIFSAAYTNTDGSNTLDTRYIIPLSPYNTTLILDYGTTFSDVIEHPFNQLDIISNSRYYDVTLRQPLFQKAPELSTQELAVGITASRRESEASLLKIPFPLSAGADDRGRTRISALRFFQEYIQRDEREVLTVRSQFSFGLDALNSTINASGPDSRFFAWLGEGRWFRHLNRDPDTVLLVRTDVQLASKALVPLEQFGLGGQTSVRGYRQDALLSDNGVFASVELQLPIYRTLSRQTVLQIIPFVDFGEAWNNSSAANNPNTGATPNTLASVGLGLQLRQGNFNARFDWGIPLVDYSSRRENWQENGLYFSINYIPF